MNNNNEKKSHSCMIGTRSAHYSKMSGKQGAKRPTHPLLGLMASYLNGRTGNTGIRRRIRPSMHLLLGRDLRVSVDVNEKIWCIDETSENLVH